eukprot:TRINITY_DN8807_c0_g1_i1.p1 TRINITY_DN8807_c0_g1~~TRINITY_DN8807_c0_g1_i1.p1  ORF type:complete len:541 (-),score=125.23 TRINITY_DN8807_c0_g1_i1:70-1692(-)
MVPDALGISCPKGGPCDALFISIGGGRSFDIFLLELHSGLDKASVLQRHIVSAAALLQALPQLSAWQQQEQRFLVRAADVGLSSEGCASCTSWAALLNPLKRPAASREALESRIRVLQDRFLRLAVVGKAEGASGDAVTDEALIAAETGSVLELMGLQRPSLHETSGSQSAGEQEAEDLRSIAHKPGRGLTALSNGVRVVAGLRQLLEAHQPSPCSEPATGEVLRQALAATPSSLERSTATPSSAPSQLGAVSSVLPSPSSAPPSDDVPTGASPEALDEDADDQDPTVRRARAWLRSRGILSEDDAVQCAAAEPSDIVPPKLLRRERNSFRRLGSQASPASTEESKASCVLQHGVLEPPSSWQGISRTWSPESRSSSSGSGADLRSPNRQRREVADGPRRPRALSAEHAAQSHEVLEAVRRAKRRARESQRRQAQEEEATLRQRLGPRGNIVPAASADLFRRRDDRIRRFVEARSTGLSFGTDQTVSDVAGESARGLSSCQEEGPIDWSFLEAEEEAMRLAGELQPSPAPEPCPLPESSD